MVLAVPEKLPDFLPPGRLGQPFDVHGIVRGRDLVRVHLLWCRDRYDEYVEKVKDGRTCRKRGGKL